MLALACGNEAFLASLLNPCPHCTECPEVEITYEGITIRETADAVRLRNLMTDVGVVPGNRSWFRETGGWSLLNVVRGRPRMCGDVDDRGQ